MSFEPAPSTTVPSTVYTCPGCGQTIVPYTTQVHVCSAWSTHPTYSLIITPAIEAVNDQIAVEPFKNDLTDVVQRGTGFNTMKGATTLTGCKVVYGNKEYPAGVTVYVRAELAKEAIGKQVLDVEGAKVTFIPIKEIRLVKRYDPNWRTAMSYSSNSISAKAE
jgi:hypothetical protein